MKPFNAFSKELLEGVNLIEASAGTGKTYSITTLVLRLLIERKLKLHEILSVTFTEAAAKELRDRVRRRLVDARNYLMNPVPNLDFDQLFSRVDHKVALARLNEALGEIDAAPIYTIHGFCQHMLQDYAFETGQSFSTEIMTENSAFVQELVEDYWRLINADYPREFFRFGTFSLEMFIEPAKSLINSGVELAASASNFNENTFKAQIVTWNGCIDWFVGKEEVIESAKDLLLKADENGSLNRRSYNEEQIILWFEQLELFVGQGSSALKTADQLQKWIDKLLPEALEAGTKKNHTTPEHDVFSQLEKLLDAKRAIDESMKELELMMIHSFAKWMPSEVARRKREANVQFFDDLLERICNTVLADPCGRLCALIRTRFPAVLIDEFQDTDLIQWGIFGTIYAPEQIDPMKNSLLLIGDPKQSIYSFRNADIDVYLKAKKSAGSNLWSMTTNYRSEPGVISALNHWAAVVGNEKCFNLPGDIDYERVNPHSTWTVNDQMLFPEGDASLMFMNCMDKEANKGNTSELAIDDTFAAIQYVLAKNRLKGELLNLGDLAVLVNTNAQASSMHQLLSGRGIPSVIIARESVFNSPVAEALYHLLTVVLSPGDESLFRGLLLTDLFTFTAAEVAALTEANWERWIRQLHEWGSLWEQEGIMAFLATADNDVSLGINLMEQTGLGERALTDLRHLIEQLSQQELEHSSSPRHLLRWYEQKRVGGESASDEDLVRLESDATRVKVVTVHRSKGMEYPIVFCPFLWAGKSPKSMRSHIYSDGEKRMFDYEDQYETLILENEAREALRCQYVALTRAKHQLWVYIAKGGQPHHNKDAPLHHWGCVTEPSEDVLKSKHVAVADMDRVRAGQTYQAPLEDALLDAVPLLSREVRKNWLLHSYSSLAGHGTAVSYIDHDETIARPVVPVAKPTGVFALPKGAVFGTQVHELFENLDFLAGAEDRAVAAKQMRELAGYDEKHEPYLLELVNQTLDMPLSPESFSLSSIPKDHRLVEMDFHFPIHTIKRAKLAEITKSAVQCPDDSCAGFMKGFIDLIFEADGKYWIADYKTNYLGATSVDYAAEALTLAMEDSGYVLQYHLYTLALHRYLRLKLPGYDYEAHIGGAFYLFVRGMGVEDHGVFFDRISKETLDAMDQLFAEGI